jgi:uncharacterized membrane protein
VNILFRLNTVCTDLNKGPAFQRGPFVFGLRNGFLFSGMSFERFSSKQYMNNRTSSILIITILCVLTFPIIIAIGGGAFGIMIGIFGAVFGTILGWIGALIGGIFNLMGEMFSLLFNWPFQVSCFFPDNEILTITLLIIFIALISRRRYSGKHNQSN